MNSTTLPTEQSPDSLSFSTAAGSPLALENPFRGTLVIAGADAGKTAAIAVPMIQQFARKNFTGLIYDFGSTTLAGAARQALAEVPAPPAPQRPVQLRSLAFHALPFPSLAQSDKVNPLHPDNLPTIAAAMEYAATLFIHSPKGGDNFFTKSAQAYLTAIIWYYRNNYPALCTIPHVVATAVSVDFKRVLHLLGQDAACRPIVQSLITAVEQGAEKQVASIIASLMVDMASLTTAEISWVLNPADGKGFSLNLNDPENPTLLTITSDPALAASASPVISCVIAVALRLMNQPKKQRSYVLLDGPETLYLPGLDTLTATARSNKIAVVCMTQDMTQLTEAYGKDKAQVLVSNLNNQFFGKPRSNETIELVARLFQHDYVYSQPAPNLIKRLLLAISGQDSQPKFSSAAVLKKGEFMGLLAGNPSGIFKASLMPGVLPRAEEVAGVQAAGTQTFKEAVEANAHLIRKQVAEVLHPNRPDSNAPALELA